MSDYLRYHEIFILGHPELGLTTIPKGWVIHHIDFNHKNNELDNLQLMTISDHMKLHSRFNIKGRFKKGHIPANKGISPSKETRDKISNSLKNSNLINRIDPTPEMIEDVKNGMSRRKFEQKYNHQGVWRRIRRCNAYG